MPGNLVGFISSWLFPKIVLLYSCKSVTFCYIRMPSGHEKFTSIADLQGWGYVNSDIRGYLAALSILQVWILSFHHMQVEKECLRSLRARICGRIATLRGWASCWSSMCPTYLWLLGRWFTLLLTRTQRKRFICKHHLHSSSKDRLTYSYFFPDCFRWGQKTTSYPTWRYRWEPASRLCRRASEVGTHSRLLIRIDSRGCSF